MDGAARLEHLVGRYGVLALATLLTLTAVSTFVRWAAIHGLLGPTTRVTLGLLLAAALATAGLRIRRREPSFGSVLLVLALAVVEVCAWAAGPGLHLVPDPAAFALATAASAVLAAYAQFERDEPLWCIGIAGAALAPFLTSSNSGNAVMLASYGAGVGIAAAVGIGSLDWMYARRTVAGVILVYAAALQFPVGAAGWAPLLAVAMPVVVALAGILPFTAEELVRPRLRAQWLIAGVAAMAAAGRPTPLGDPQTSVAFATALLLWLVVADRTCHAAIDGPTGVGDAEPFEPAWIDGALIPLLFVAAASSAWSDAPWWRAGILMGSAAVLCGALWRRAPGASRDALALSAAAAAFAAVTVAPFRMDVAYPVAYAAVAVACVPLLVRRPSYSWLAAAGAGLAVAAAYTWMLMFVRPEYAYAPFGTRESAAALVVFGACVWVVAQTDRMARALGDAVQAGAPAPGFALSQAGWVRALPWVWAFLWAHRELAGAWSPALATFLLVTLEAAVGVALVALGRLRDVRPMRQTGLVLAVVGAIRALSAIERVPSVSLRIASYLVASVFLLGIAYGYRRRGAPADAAPEPSEM